MQDANYDVVVIGAGPAGASAARAAGQSGVSVLLVDARLHPGTPVQCAEYVPRLVRKYTPLVAGAVIQKIDNMLTYVNDRLLSELASPGYILDRTVFDDSLVQEAIKAGAELWPGKKAVARTEEGIIVRSRENVDMPVKCRVIIGADGPRSTVGQWMKSNNEQYMIGLQYRLPLVKPQSSTDIYFKPQYEGGYAWLFPKREYANVGVGVAVRHSRKLPDLINDFVASLSVRGLLADSRPVIKTSGLIPTGGPLEVTVSDNMLLAGDAAGHTHPVTGGGIMNAIAAGRMAGEAAARAVIKRDLHELSHYSENWQSFLGRHLVRAARQRQDLDQNWTYDSKDFEELIRRTWISFGPAENTTGRKEIDAV